MADAPSVARADRSPSESVRGPEYSESGSAAAGGSSLLTQMLRSEWGIIVSAILFAVAVGYLYVRSREVSHAARGEMKTNLSRPGITETQGTANDAERMPAERIATRVSVRPETIRVLVLAGILGAVLGGILAWISFHLNVVSSASDPERDFGVPLLGSIPRVDGSPAVTALATACAGHGLRAVADTVALIQTALSAWAGGRGLSSLVLVVTAPDAGAGKTVVSANLAMALAQAGRRTLLVDGDVRRPALDRVFPVCGDKSSWVAAVADGTEDALRDSVQQTDELLLATALLGRRAKRTRRTRIPKGEDLTRFVGWARRRYDCVLFDSPPADICDDALVMGAAADGVLLVCRCDQTRRMAMRRTLERLAAAGLPVAGIVLNDWRESR